MPDPATSAGATPPRLNREWHLLHKMPDRPTLEERIDWHVAHAANCGCRPIPERLLREMEQRGMTAPTPRSLR